jgi:uncharacterized protein (DUF488 family)
VSNIKMSGASEIGMTDRAVQQNTRTFKVRPSAPKDRPMIWTIGYDSIPVERVAALLRALAVGVVIDVRARPGQSSPHILPEGPLGLTSRFAAAGIDYEWHGKLGTSDETTFMERYARYPALIASPEWQAEVDAIEARARSGQRMALACTERSYWLCHRTMIADGLVGRGIEVVHLIDHLNPEPYPGPDGGVDVDSAG